jgi:c(7)-type cytochrome triheme protein
MRLFSSFLALSCLLALLLPGIAGSKIGGDDITYNPKGAAKVVFQHEYHVNVKGMKCNNCHYQKFQMRGNSAYAMDMGTLTKGQFCGSCHDGTKAFDVKDAANCGRCHKG